MTFIAQYLRRGEAVKFRETNAAALGYLPSLVRTWLPEWHRCGNEWVSRNPTRPDKSPGSFSVNLKTGRWADFATGDKGGDVISLAAYLFGTRQIEAARTLAVTLGLAVRS